VSTQPQTAIEAIELVIEAIEIVRVRILRSFPESSKDRAGSPGLFPIDSLQNPFYCAASKQREPYEDRARTVPA
jgi:hypothetical protein